MARRPSKKKRDKVRAALANDPNDMLFVGADPKAKKHNPREEARRINKLYERRWQHRMDQDHRAQRAKEYGRQPRKRDVRIGGVEFYKAPNTFAERLSKLGYKTYREYLRSKHWRNVKRRYRESVELPQACFVCGDERYELHHKTYARIGHELLTDFAPLCRGCHEAAHALENEGVSIQDAPDVLRERSRVT